MPTSTKHFKNCLGVFQGGGCKALAFVGAYREAYERGVFFSQVAGTSAGSIVAALIAAGASPAEVQKAVLETKFDRFLRPPEKAISGGRYPVVSAVSLVGTKKLKLVVRFLQNLGLFSSAEIESWLESRLRTLLPAAPGKTVTFADLNIPLHVVATEVGTAKPIIWNSETTPHESVSYAVRCSCTIPLLFQPVAGRFVDGGVVSNLPSFAISRASRGAFEKLLCFTFAPSPSQTPEDVAKQDPEQYLLRLVASIIDGGTSIQSSLQNDLHVVEIGALPLGTLDFGKIDQESIRLMFEAGAQAASSFFNSEAIRLQADGNTRPILLTEPQALNQMVREEGGSRDEIWIALWRTRYVYNLFPTLLHWRMSGARITVFTGSLAASAPSAGEVRHERFRRLVLECLGAKVVEVSSLPFEGVFFQRDGGLGNAVVLEETRAEETLANFAVKYDRQQDAAAIRSMLASLQQVLATGDGPPSVPRIELMRGGVDTVVSRLKTVEQYKDKEVVLDFEEVDVERIVFLTKYVKSYKYGQIGRLFDIYREQTLRLFEGVQIRYTSSRGAVTMPVTPPVAEEHDGHLFLLEGNSRLTYLIKEQRAKRVCMIVVKNVSARLPATGQFTANQLLISDEGKIGSERYEGWQRSDYRPIEEAVRRPELYAGVSL